MTSRPDPRSDPGGMGWCLWVLGRVDFQGPRLQEEKARPAGSGSLNK